MQILMPHSMGNLTVFLIFLTESDNTEK